MKFKLERDVDECLERKLNKLGLRLHKDYNMESEFSDYMKESLKGGSKTVNKSDFGIPDYSIEKYREAPVIFENKLHKNKMVRKTNTGKLSESKAAISGYAINGVFHYARNMIASDKYKTVIAIAVAGDNTDNLTCEVFYVYSSSKSCKPKRMSKYDNLGFLENQRSFSSFYRDATLTEREKYDILIKNQHDLVKQAKDLNELMEHLNISVNQRVVYVSGMLLAMQEVKKNKIKHVDNGLIPSDLQGKQTDQKRDSIIVVNQIKEFLEQRGNLNDDKLHLMMESFRGSISNDKDKDKLDSEYKNVDKLIKEPKASITKQIFTFIYFNVYKSIHDVSGSLDIMGEMYSQFLKYALSDGASLGKVLTPPYITRLMAKLINVDKDSHVMDLATGSGAFLVSSMALMIQDANNYYGAGTLEAHNKIHDIKCKQLLGVELDAKMYTLAASNMILRGDGSTQIKKHDTFRTPDKWYKDFKPTKFLLNPPFSYKYHGMPFVKFGLRHMKKNGEAAVIIQDTAGSGKATNINQEILSHNTLLASIKMPTDLFVPNASVQTSIYIFLAGVPQDYNRPVKFIDFRNDGYKRSSRGIYSVDHPRERYHDLILLIKAGKAATKNPKFHNKLWDLKSQYAEGFISNKGNRFGNDWNFEQHQYIDLTPTKKDFNTVVGNYMGFRINQFIKKAINNEQDTRKD